MKAEVISITINIIQCVVSCVVILRLQSIIRKDHKYFSNNISLTDQMLKYCLNDMLSRYIQNEDYINAAKCKEIINSLNNESRNKRH